MQFNRLENTESEHSMIKKKFEMIQKIAAFKQLLFEFNHMSDFRQYFRQINEFINSLNDRFDDFLNFIDTNYFNNLQQIFDAKQEMNCFLSMSEALKLIIENRFHGDGKRSLTEALGLLLMLEPFTDQNEHKFKLLVNEAENYKLVKQLQNISDISPHSLLIKAYLYKSKAHKNINFAVKSIKRYNNTELRRRFENNFSKSDRMLLWHGTCQTNLESILREGLKLPENTGNQMFGNGIYFADRVTKSFNYTDCGRNRSDIGTLLLCEVAVGNM